MSKLYPLPLQGRHSIVWESLSSVVTSQGLKHSFSDVDWGLRERRQLAKYCRANKELNRTLS